MTNSILIFGSFLYGQPCSERNTAYLQPISPKLPLQDEINCLDITSFKKHLRHRPNLSNYTDFFKKVVKVDTLYADHMNLTKFPVAVVRRLPNLETIDLSGNKIRRLPNKMFKLARKVNKLLVPDNEITVPKRNPLIASTTLKTLMLSNNGIVILHKFTFAKMPALEVLYLDSNKLRTIAPIFGTLPNLKYLHVGQNYLKTIPDKSEISNSITHYITKSQKTYEEQQ